MAERRVYQIQVVSNLVNAFSTKFGRSSEVDCTNNTGYSIFSPNEASELDLREYEAGSYRICVLASFQASGWQNEENAKVVDFELGVRKPSTGGDGVVENPVPPPSTNTCEDVQPPQSPYPCSQQKEWGKCGRDWMVGYCRKSCGTCN